MSGPRLELEVLGNPDEGFRAFNKNEDGQGRGLAPCPFCRSSHLRVENAGHPYYKVHCWDCGAEGPAGHSARLHEGMIDSAELCRRLHQEAFNDAVTRWNRRPGRCS